LVKRVYAYEGSLECCSLFFGNCTFSWQSCTERGTEFSLFLLCLSATLFHCELKLVASPASLCLFSLILLSSYVTYTHKRFIYEMMHRRKKRVEDPTFSLKSRSVHTTSHAVIICTLVYIYSIIKT